MSKLEFLKSKAFYLHFLIASGVAFVLIVAFVFTLKLFTLHGQSVQVPDFRNVMVKDLDKFIQDTELSYVINDSASNMKLPKGIVLEQDPAAGSSVKPGRKIYLTINGILTPKVAMPNLIDLSIRQATTLIEAYGLKLGKISYVNGFPPVIEQNSNGKQVKPGEMIEKGSVIDLVAGKGNFEESDVNLPNLIGLNLVQAKNRLSVSKILLGNVFYDESVNDTLKAKVFKQIPDPDLEEKISSSKAVDIWLTQNADLLNE